MYVEPYSSCELKVPSNMLLPYVRVRTVFFRLFICMPWPSAEHKETRQTKVSGLNKPSLYFSQYLTQDV